MLNKVLHILNGLIEQTSIGHRDYATREKEKKHRQSPEYKRWLQNYKRKKRSPGYRPDTKTSQAAERSARFKRDY